MKKLMTILGAVLLGMGSAAQAQLKLHPAVAESDKLVEHTHLANMHAVPVVDIPQLKQAGNVYDTLRWGGYYVDKPKNGPCATRTYASYWGKGEGFFTDPVTMHGLGSNANGSGESGASYITKNDIFYAYSGHRLSDWEVVGAVAAAYRMGSHSGWEEVGMPTGELYEGHVSAAEGEGVPTDELYPELPYIMKGYPEVQSQPAITSYSKQQWDLISVTMPVTLEGVSKSAVGYLPMGLRGLASDGVTVMPALDWAGGLFDKPFPADQNYGVSLEAQLTGDIRYDSLWCYGIGVKMESECTELDYMVSWTRFDFRNPNGFNYWIFGEPVDASLSLDEGGLAPDGCPQHDMDSSLFVYAWSVFQGRERYLPAIYGIIQRKTANESSDAYAKTISVYPVPATDKVNLVSVDAMQRIELYNMAGSLLKHITLNDNVAELDVTDMVPGTYVVRIATEKGVASKKVLVR